MYQRADHDNDVNILLLCWFCVCWFCVCNRSSKKYLAPRLRILSRGAKYFFEDLLHPLVRRLFLHLKEATSHLQ